MLKRLLAPIVFCLLAYTQIPAQPSVPNAVGNVFVLRYANELADTTDTLPFGQVALETYGSLINAVAQSDLPDSEKIAVTVILNQAAERRSSPDRVIDQFGILDRALRDGTWAEFGIPMTVLPPPTPEQRARILGALDAWVREETAKELSALCQTGLVSLDLPSEPPAE